MSNYYFNNNEFRSDMLKMLILVFDNGIQRGFDTKLKKINFYIDCVSIIHPWYFFYENVLQLSKEKNMSIDSRKDLVYVGNTLFAIDKDINEFYRLEKEQNLSSQKITKYLSQMVGRIESLKTYIKTFDEDNFFTINLHSSFKKFFIEYEDKRKLYKTTKTPSSDASIMNSLMYNNYFYYLLTNKIIELNKNKVSQEDSDKLITVFNMLEENKKLISACYNNDDNVILSMMEKKIPLLDRGMEKIKKYLENNLSSELQESSKYQTSTGYKI